MPQTTYRLHDAVLTVDVDGTPVTIECAATSLGIVAEQNYASHPRTGCDAPFEEWIDSSHTVELGYAHAYGTDGIWTVFDGLAGTIVNWQLETGGAAVVSADFPKFTWTAAVPALSALPQTDWGEFAQGDVSIPVKGQVTSAIV